MFHSRKFFIDRRVPNPSDNLSAYAEIYSIEDIQNKNLYIHLFFKHMTNFKKLFPLSSEKNETPSYLKEFFKILFQKSKKDQSRISNKKNKKNNFRKYFKLPLECRNPLKKGREIVNDFFEDIPDWRSPNLNFNIGSPVNIVASSIYALSLDSNIYAINEGLSGKTLIAEKAVSNILGDLINKKNIRGFFTYGGSGTNLYGMKLGIQKAMPKSNKKGITHKIKILITEDSHFAHVYSADWLGIGTNNIIKIKANKDRTSNLKDAEKKLRNLLVKKIKIGTIILNGGTSYSHTIDHIKRFVSLRDKMAKEFNLDYLPHIHVDSVIGWMWLFFRDYDFKKNTLNIKEDCLNLIKKQYKKIAQLKYADSWGVDFHKGIGGCPVDSSIFIFNNQNDQKLFSKKDNVVKGISGLHQIAEGFNTDSPVNYTLENSRPSAPFLSALTSLHTMGQNGFRMYLSKLIENSQYIKKLVGKRKDIEIQDPDKLGFVLMLRLYPPEYANKKIKCQELENKKIAKEINDYNQKFFDWDFKTRILKNNSLEYSYSTYFYEFPCGEGMHTLKIYPVSPHVNKGDTNKLIKTIFSQKDIFDNRNKNG